MQYVQNRSIWIAIQKPRQAENLIDLVLCLPGACQPTCTCMSSSTRQSQLLDA